MPVPRNEPRNRLDVEADAIPAAAVATEEPRPDAAPPAPAEAEPEGPTDTPPPPPPSPEEEIAALKLQLAERDRLLRVRDEADRRRQESIDRCADRETEMNRTKKVANAAKADFETAVEEHFALERSLKTGQLMLPLADPAAAALESPQGDADESWRAVPLDVLEVSGAVLQKLHDAGLATIGDLSNFTSPGPTGHTKQLKDISGIGTVAVTKIESALDAFWAKCAPVEPSNGHVLPFAGATKDAGAP
jgi:hypothetical protein